MQPFRFIVIAASLGLFVGVIIALNIKGSETMVVPNYVTPMPQSSMINPKDYGRDCELVSECNGIYKVNCRSEADGPLYYVNQNAEIIEYCGGYCYAPQSEEYCRQCPPELWTCDQE